MQNRDSILTNPLAFISLAVMTVSAPLGAQIAGDSVRVFSGDTTIVGQITGLSDEGFEFANGRFVAYRDLDRLEVSNGVGSWAVQGIAIGSVLGALAGFGEVPEDDGPVYDIGNGLEGIAIGGLLGIIGSFVEYESWKPISVPDYFVPLLGDEFPYGGRVRVSVDGNEIIGRATAMTGEGFEFVQGGMRRSFAYPDIDGLEWSRGMRSRWKTGLGLGLLGGFIAFPTFNGAWGCVASPDFSHSHR